MRKLFVLFAMLLCTTLKAQNDTSAIKNTIQQFFKGMHSNDTAVISASLDSSCFLYSVMQKKDGSTLLVDEKIPEFYQQVIQLKGQKIEERLLSYDIKTDGAMGIAWTPYQLYFNDQLYHCGVNVFTLIKRNGNWKIMGITDTRRRTGCQ